MKTILAVLTLLAATAAGAQTTIFNCSSGFSATTSALCGVAISAITGGSGTFGVYGATNGTTPAVSSGQVNLVNASANHVALSLNYQTAVNVQAFTTNYLFVPNGQNVSFTINNATICGSFGCNNGPHFSAGAGCEGGFFQAFNPTNAAVNNIMAVMLDSYGDIPAGGGTFGYSSTQLYQMNQSPCNPNDSGPNYWGTTKISTSPVPLNNPATTQNTTTGDTYSETITYDGTNLSECLYDVTLANGSCSSGTSGTGVFFQKTFTAVNVPALAHGNTGFIGITASSGTTTSPNPLLIKSWTYTVNTAPSLPSLSTWTTKSYAGASAAAAPVFSPAAGSYAGTQNVTLSTSTPGGYICYFLATPSSTLILPWPSNDQAGTYGEGACQNGTLYTGPVSVPSSQTLYAVAGTTYTTLPSATVAAAYTIGTVLLAPTFTPVAGTYAGTQSVTINLPAGSTGCYTVDGSTPLASTPGTCSHGTTGSGPVSVASSLTINAISTRSGFANSTVANAPYVITLPTAATPTFSPAGGTYTSAQTVSVADTTSSPTIYCTTDGTTPTTGSPVYSAPFTVAVTKTIKCIATASGFLQSAVGTAVYTISFPTLATPTFTPPAGSYSGPQTVTIHFPSGSTGCVGINTTPTATTAGTCGSGGSIYTGPIPVSASAVVNAIATQSGFINSPLNSANYTISTAPVACITITINSTTSGTVTMTCNP